MTVIPLTECTSSALAAHGYEPSSRTLAIKFKATGTVSHFADVPPEIAAGLASAKSVGTFFAANVRGKFDRVAVIGGESND